VPPPPAPTPPAPPFPPPGVTPACSAARVQPVPTAFVAPVATTPGTTTPVDLTVPLQWVIGATDTLAINVPDDFVVARFVRGLCVRD
jgi:hypothetical protein